MFAWAAYGVALLLYAIGRALHRRFGPRLAPRRGRQDAGDHSLPRDHKREMAFAVSRRRWSLRRHRLALMRMRLDGVEFRQACVEKNPDAPARPLE